MIYYNLSAFSVSIIMIVLWISILLINKKVQSKNLKIGLTVFFLLIMISIPLINQKLPIGTNKIVYEQSEEVKEYDYKIIGKHGSDLYIDQEGKVIKFNMLNVSKTDQNKVKIAHPSAKVSDDVLNKEQSNMMVNKFVINPDTGERILTNNFKSRLHSLNTVSNYIKELEIKDDEIKKAKDLSKDDLVKLNIYIEQ